ncbi:hypothetical protein LVD17_00015 [Fulvivirga ulvae]|uniref:hypothetical protein n=1 Tax=Fulvivirga ulvae TaxID=2904245 RepID=UPI001F4609E2|nr:hypothetical protein [Fulvivirga ulvae]UII32220.1 hypothetical protein LVD17_00015 [Fulvivirga ulvae]
MNSTMLDEALKWSLKQKSEDFTMTKLQEAIIQNAWLHLKENEFNIDLLAENIIVRLTNYENIFPITDIFGGTKDIITPNAADRRKVAQIVINKLNKYTPFLFQPISYSSLLDSRDLEWVIDRFKNDDIANKEKWLEIISNIFNPKEKNHIEKLFALIQNENQAKKKLEHFFKEIRIDSEEAEDLKKRYKLIHGRLESQRKHEEYTLQPSVTERILNTLARYTSGDEDAWWYLCRELTLKDDSRFYGNELSSDITKLNGWIICDEHTRKNILEAAKSYIKNNDCKKDDWLGTNIFNRPAASGYKALILIKKCEPQFLEKLTDQDWQNWAHILLSYPESIGLSGTDTSYLDLIKKAYEHAPLHITEAVMKEIEKEDEKEDGYFLFLTKIEGFADEKVIRSNPRLCQC